MKKNNNNLLKIVNSIIYIVAILFIFVSVVFDESSFMGYIKTNFRYTGLVLLLLCICSQLIIYKKRK